jgi:NAD(P)-dependent dehydrogenase (short-subunit alcohol dehydrogenase family)
LKNNGYHLERNIGHGRENLAIICAAMNLARTPTTPFRTPQEVAAAVVFLAPPLAAYIIGQTLEHALNR